jgi:hypothetical protein
MAESQVLKRLDSPAYCIRVLDNGLVAIAGGGGKAKTGVGNLIELGLIDYHYENKSSSISNNDGQARFKTIHTFEPDDAIMKFVSFTLESNQRDSRNKKESKEKNHTKNSTNKNINIKYEHGSANRDIYLAAAVNDTVEIYKLSPKLQATYLKSNNLETNHLKNRKGESFCIF